VKGQQPSRVARYNRAVVLDLVRRFGPISKTELAERSGLAVSSVLNVISSLSRQGLVRTVGFGPSTGGRPPALIELDPEARYAAGVNIHSAGVEAVLLNLAGDIVGRTTLPIQGVPGIENAIDTAVEAVEQVLRLAHVDPGRILGAGVGVPEAGDMSLSGERLERRLGLPVSVDRSANLCALAEYRHGVGKNAPHDTLIYVYADESIADGVIVEGKVFRGALGGGGDLGHTVIDINGPACGCGSYGCLDTLASVHSIIRRVIAHGKLTGETELGWGPTGDWDAVSFAAIAQALERGDRVVGSIVDQSLAYLSLGVANLIALLQPARIVLGGRLFDEMPSAYDRFMRALSSRQFIGSSECVTGGEFGAVAAPLGAATLMLEEFFGIPEQVMSVETLSDAAEPSFDSTLVWPLRAEESDLLSSSGTTVLSAGNLRPPLSRVPFGEPVTVTVDVTLSRAVVEADTDVKALLHWDRVAVFGGNWPNPKNSPMHRMTHQGASVTYSITLGSLPPGKYEFAAHIIGANDIWVPTVGAREPNGRLEVLESRDFAREQGRVRKGRKEGERVEADVLP
jgi:predicted NBD/HSP70 family sugar kinase